jgi:hypothetical protein
MPVERHDAVSSTSPLGPWKLWGKPGSLGRVSRQTFVVWAASSAVFLLGLYLVSGSEPIQALSLFGVVWSWDRLRRRAAKTNRLPLYPDPAPMLRPAWQRWGGLLLISAVLGAILGLLSDVVGGGVFFWMFVGLIVPMAFVANRDGVMKRAKRKPKQNDEL